MNNGRVAMCIWWDHSNTAQTTSRYAKTTGLNICCKMYRLAASDCGDIHRLQHQEI